MGLFRRREPLHERLAREGGIGTPPLPEAGPPGWMETGVHGVHRARKWDTVVTVEAEGVDGDQARFVALPDHTLLVEEGGDVEPLAEALDGVVESRTGRRPFGGARASGRSACSASRWSTCPTGPMPTSSR